MRLRFVRLPTLMLGAALLLSVPLIATVAPGPAYAEAPTLSVLQQRVTKMKTAAAALRELGQKAPPADHSAKQKVQWEKQSQLLLEHAAQLLDWCGKFEKLIDKMKAKLDTKDNEALSLAWLKAQSLLEKECSDFQTLSNASKARHDVALNAIRNMK